MSLLWSNPWPVLGPALGGVFVVVIAVELVVSLVRDALTADDGRGGDV